jgi:ATP-dependent helicase/nuclease subunit A
LKELTPYQEAALDYSKHISLTANAGSGKTFVLSKRFVQIALCENVPLNSIVAITFTDKAAGELNRKVANEIDERIKAEKNNNIIRKLERLRNQLVFANISTIHSFCINILKEFSPEAGIDANFIPIDKTTSDELIDLSIQEVLKEGFRNDEKIDNLKALIRFFGSKANFEIQVKSAVERRKNLLNLYDSVYSGTVESIEAYYKNNFTGDFNKIFYQKLINSGSAFKKINNAVLEKNPKNDKALAVKGILEKYKSAKEIEKLFSRFKELTAFALTQKGDVCSRGYLSDDRDAFSPEIDFLKNLFIELGNFDEIKDDKNCNELARFAKSFASVIVDINNKYEARKKQKGFLDFEDILLKTRDILRLDEVKEYLGRKYKFIMVDEYQDTNEIQYEIIMPILDNLNSGNLCVVGDEKQSIYMFRDADLEVFSRTKEKISEIKTEESLLTLPHSFRLAPRIALFINHVFKKLFADPEPLFNEVSHSDLFCARTDDTKGQVEFILCDENGETKEAELVARKIIELYNNGTVINRFSDVLILCRKRNSFKELETAFSKYKIPFAVVGGKGFFQKQTTLDVYNYISFLLNKDNDTALLGILRAPFYTVSDTELFAISLCEGRTFFEKLLKYAEGNKNIQNASNMIQQHLNEVNSYSFAQLIRKVLNDTSYWAIMSEKPSAAQEIANLEKLIANARKYSLQGYKTLYDYAEQLKESIETLEDEGQAEIIDNGDSVKIMTIHQAKGLESKAVFVFNTNEKERDNSIKAKTVLIDKKYGIIAKVPPGGNYFEKYTAPPIAGLYNYVIKKKNEAETKRLLYVALTRAIDYLCVSATHSDFQFDKGSLAGYLFNAAAIKDAEIKITDELIYLLKKEARFEKIPLKEELVIPLIKEIELQSFSRENEKTALDNVEILTGSVSRKEKNEFISASKISVFAQCPFKYYLTYEIGFSKLYKRMKTFRENFEFNRKEDDQAASLSDIRGTLIHSILEKELAAGEIEAYVKEMIERWTAADISEKKNYEKVEHSILEGLKLFFDSGAYRQLREYKRYKNEFEVYAAEGDYFLYGIVDKIVYDNGKIIIIDYKTDSVKKEEIKERAASYFNQLKFYAYTINKSMKKDYEFELRILFIKHPDAIEIMNLKPGDLENYGTELAGIIDKMRNYQFDKNLYHCPQCHLSDDNNNCVKK